MPGLAKRFLDCESGVTAIEYAFIAALISLSIIFGATAIGNGVGNSFNNVADGFDL
ncbi:Flp family type IVb pilin [Nitratireductor sp. XY-223]|uniref:Flp family type IVb pilin n=1 Tax=Nitratireductor sp. XY-223 TaxID=2561926 RepID=UPI0010AA789D|nr:Flp family type IVb pilin [Nitratireductor sp. XY-223]